MSFIDSEIKWFKQVQEEAKAVREREGIELTACDELYQRTVVEGDWTPLVGAAAPSPESALERFGSQHSRTPRVTAPKAAREPKANRYAGPCLKCKSWVEAGAGLLAGKPGAWAVEHRDGECVQAAPAQALWSDIKPAAHECTTQCSFPGPNCTALAAPAPRPARPQVTEGFYKVDDDVYKVQQALNSDRLYAKRLDKETGSFEYAAGSLKLIAGRGVKLGVEEAGALGKLYGKCIVCGRKLTDEFSIERGIGRICFEKF